jgi:sirohydrochlorin cobaltochelatase
MKHGLLLFAHGARDPRWALPFEDVVRRIRAREPSLPVALAFLEFMAPAIVEAGNALVAQGCDSIDVVPLFLGAGGHVRKDLPALAAALESAHPGLRVALAPAVGEHPLVVAALAEAAAALPSPTATP